MRLTERNDKTILGLWHYDIPSIPHAEPDCYSMGDVWSLWLDNLRRYLEGRPVTRLDFSTSRRGDLSSTVEIDGSVADVTLSAAEMEIRGNVEVCHLTRGFGSDYSCGVRFFPSSDDDRNRLIGLVSRLEALDRIRS